MTETGSANVDESAKQENTSRQEAVRPDPVRSGGGAGAPAPRKSKKKAVTLKEVAKHLCLSPATVSVVLNRSPVADSIPHETQERVFAAALELKDRPNHLARSVRSRRTRTIGVLLPEIVEPYSTGVLSGLETHFIQQGYFYLVASHRSQDRLLEEYLDLMRTRLVEGLVMIATALKEPPPVPTVVVAGHEEVEGVTNVVLDHEMAAELALRHLIELGHSKIAFFKGQVGNADTEDRWRGIRKMTSALDIELRRDLIFQLAGEPGDEISRTEQAFRQGVEFGRSLLEKRDDFTAVFAFNDLSAIGTIQALVAGGLRVPEDVSVIGFDDIVNAKYYNPGLTTVRQPLHEMGATAGGILLEGLKRGEEVSRTVTIDPELVVRATTARVR